MIAFLAVCFYGGLFLIGNHSALPLLESRDNYDAIFNLLPLYGGTKLDKLLNKASLDKVKGYFDKNPANYEKLRSELATEGVFVPALKDLNLSVIVQEDYNILKSLVGSYTLKQALNSTFALKIIDDIKNDQVLYERLMLRFDQAGIKFGETVDLLSVGGTMYDAFEPMVPSFMFTGINIILFGY